MEECSNDDDMYLKADQLLAHMTAKHSCTKWMCNPCWMNAKQTSEADQSDQSEPQVLVFFDSAESWQAHTEKEHGNLGSALQRDVLTKLSKRQLIVPLECPLCESEPTKLSTGIDEHILKHLHEFALRALPGDAGPTNEEESTAFQIASSASLLSYTKDSWTAYVKTPNDNTIGHKAALRMLDYIKSKLERYDSDFRKKAQTDLGRCWNIVEYGIQDLSTPLSHLWHAFDTYCEFSRVHSQPHTPSNGTLEMEMNMLNEALERILDMGDIELTTTEKLLRLLKGNLKLHPNATYVPKAVNRLRCVDLTK
jgi:hypothetical protein